MKYIYIAFTHLVLLFNSIAGDYTALKTIAKPIIDGNASDNCWTTATWAPIDQLWVGTATNSTDYSGRFKVAWDDSLVYILVEITDDIFHDTHSNPLQNYWDDDCIEIFIDENHSGGNHEYNYNAFAYHVSPLGDVVDNNTTTAALFNKHLKVDVDTNGKVYTWEVAMRVYTDQFNPNNLNLNRITLTSGKVMGFSMAYNDSDNQTTRENMYGSQLITAADKNISYKNADVFGTLTLANNPLVGVDESNFLNSSFYFNNTHKELIFNTLSNIVQVEILSLSGTIVQTITHAELSNHSISLNHLPAGFYIVKDNQTGNYLKILIE